MSRLVAIHQPNFLPWLGYFDKIARADVFVLLDHVQFSKTGGTWSNRVQLLVNGEAAWVTMPIVRAYHGVRTYREMEIEPGGRWRDKLLKTIRLNYAAAPYFAEVFPVLEAILHHPSANLAEFNEAAIRALCAGLGLSGASIVRSSELPVAGAATDMLVSLVQAVGGDAYLAGGQAAAYQQDDKFAAAGIEVVWQNFRHPVYSQGNHVPFTPGLSIVDALMHCGWRGARDLLSKS